LAPEVFIPDVRGTKSRRQIMESTMPVSGACVMHGSSACAVLLWTDERCLRFPLSWQCELKQEHCWAVCQSLR